MKVEMQKANPGAQVAYSTIVCSAVRSPHVACRVEHQGTTKAVCTAHKSKLVDRVLSMDL